MAQKISKIEKEFNSKLDKKYSGLKQDIADKNTLLKKANRENKLLKEMIDRKNKLIENEQQAFLIKTKKQED